MNPFALQLLLVAATVAAPTTEVRYTGTLTQLDRNGDRRQVKQFDIGCLVTEGDATQREIVFVVTENGGAAAAWPERFGRIVTRFDPPEISGAVIRLLYSHQERLQLLTLPAPVFEHRDKLDDGAEWSTDAFRYTVLGSREVNSRKCWEVEVSSQARGGTVTLLVDAGSGLVVSGSRRLTMGRGDLFELEWQLETERPLTADEADRARKAVDSLLALQTELGREPENLDPALSPSQLEIAAAAIEGIQERAKDTPFERLAAVISRDIQAQQQRAASVQELEQQFVGRAAPEFALLSLDGKAIPAESHSGKTIVLHFWEYRDEPLEEPYGQVGYLDFLMNRHPAAKLAVYGVSVDRRLRDPATASQAIRSAKKLKSFMNLGYDIAVDRDGKLLQAFGDPTRFDAALPLWVIIGPDGKIAHYRTGYYEVDRDIGLAELDAVVGKLVEGQ